MKFLFFLFAVASICFVAIKADDDENLCEDFEVAQEGLEKIHAHPEKFLQTALNAIANKIHGKNSILLSVLTPVAVLIQGIIEVIDSIATYTLPNGETVFQIVRDAILFSLKIFVGHNEEAWQSWSKFVTLIFSTLSRVYRILKPVLVNIVEELTP